MAVRRRTHLRQPRSASWSPRLRFSVASPPAPALCRMIECSLPDRRRPPTAPQRRSVIAAWMAGWSCSTSTRSSAANARTGSNSQAAGRAPKWARRPECLSVCLEVCLRICLKVCRRSSPGMSNHAPAGHLGMCRPDCWRRIRGTHDSFCIAVRTAVRVSWTFAVLAPAMSSAFRDGSTFALQRDSDDS